MSRGHLFRKLKAVSNLTISQFILNVKLKIAIPLLQERKLSISEIAYNAGFSSPSHFSTVCKRMYGKTPTKLMSEKNISTEKG